MVRTVHVAVHLLLLLLLRCMWAAGVAWTHVHACISCIRRLLGLGGLLLLCLLLLRSLFRQ